jgi:hypothetical protein
MTSKLTLLEHFKMPPVKGLMLPDTHYKETPGMVDPEREVGLELEIEGWRSGAASLPHFNYTTDGSLRNNGIEAISHPTKSKYVREMLNQFFTTHRVTEANYTERCSTHVHVNVQDFTLEELKVMALTYQMVERLLFEFVGNDRANNIFCVPWYESGITANFITNMKQLSKAALRGWMKYTALNLQPAQEKGTVEFRHLEGTCDVEKIVQWINLLNCLSKWAKKVSFDALSTMVLSMNTISNYGEFLRDVFGDHLKVLMVDGYKEKLAIGVVDAKLMLLKNAPKAMVFDPFQEPPPEEYEMDEEERDEERWDIPPARQYTAEELDSLLRDTTIRVARPRLAEMRPLTTSWVHEWQRGDVTLGNNTVTFTNEDPA